MITGLNSPFEAGRLETFRDWVCEWKHTNYSQSVSDYPSRLNMADIVEYFKEVHYAFLWDS